MCFMSHAANLTFLLYKSFQSTLGTDLLLYILNQTSSTLYLVDPKTTAFTYGNLKLRSRISTQQIQKPAHQQIVLWDHQLNDLWDVGPKPYSQQHTASSFLTYSFMYYDIQRILRSLPFYAIIVWVDIQFCHGNGCNEWWGFPLIPLSADSANKETVYKAHLCVNKEVLLMNNHA